MSKPMASTYLSINNSRNLRYQDIKITLIEICTVVYQKSHTHIQKPHHRPCTVFTPNQRRKKSSIIKSFEACGHRFHLKKSLVYFKRYFLLFFFAILQEKSLQLQRKNLIRVILHIEVVLFQLEYACDLNISNA